MKDVNIGGGWKEKLTEQFGAGYFQTLTEFVRAEYLSRTVYPNPKHIFRAFDETPFDSVRVVILGQDPYHGARQANGLASLDADLKVPEVTKTITRTIIEKKNQLYVGAGLFGNPKELAAGYEFNLSLKTKNDRILEAGYLQEFSGIGYFKIGYRHKLSFKRKGHVYS